MSAISVGQAVVLGAVEGVTEFLPVSSTGHLKITEGLMGIPVDDDAVVGFSAVIQVGAIAAVLVYFRKDIARIVSAWLRGLTDTSERHHDYKFGWWMIYATIPIVVVGLAAKPLIQGPLASLWVVAGSLIAGSGVMWAADRTGRRQAGRGRHLAQGRHAGRRLADPRAALPRLLPLRRHHVDRAPARPRPGRRHPAVLLPRHPGAHRRRPVRAEGRPGHRGRGRTLVVGTAVSFVVAYASIAWLLRFVAKHSFNAFVIYRIVVGLLLFGLLATGVLDS